MYDQKHEYMTGFKTSEAAQARLDDEIAAGFIGSLERPFIHMYWTRDNKRRFAIMTIEQVPEP